MPKAVLVMDMPENCFKCRLQNFLNCKIVKGCHVGGNRPDWCPLRELPEKMKVCGKYPQPDGITPSYKVGWNACLDEILKDDGMRKE